MKDKNLFNIGEAAAALGITHRTLRYYEQKGLLMPDNTDKQTGYRYYDAQDLQDILLVLLLRDAGMSIEEVGAYIHKAITPQEQIKLLKEQLNAVQRSIDLLKTHCAVHGVYEPKRKKLPRRICVCKDFIANDVISFITIYQSCIADIIRMGFTLSREYLNFCEYPAEAFLENDLNLNNFPVKICVPVNTEIPMGEELPEGVVVYPEQDVVSVDYRGLYEDMYQAYEAIYHFMEEHHLEQNGNPQEIYIDSSNTAFSSDQYLTRVIVPIKKKS